MSICFDSLDLLDGEQTRSVVLHALRLHYNLSCSPERRDIQKVFFHQPQPITWARIVCGSWLLVAMSDNDSSVLSLYSTESLLGARAQDLLAQVFLEGPVLNGLVEVSSGPGIVIALELRTAAYVLFFHTMHIIHLPHTFRSTLEVLSVRNRQGSLEFVRLFRHTGISHIRAIHGQYIGFALHDDLSVPSILDWKTGLVTHLFDRPDTDVSPLIDLKLLFADSSSYIKGGVIAMILDDVYVAYLTPRKLHVMQTHSFMEGGPRPSVVATYPLDRSIASATLTFCRNDEQVLLQVCVTNSRGIYMYAAPISHAASTSTNSRMSLLWLREAGRVVGTPFRVITQPLFDQTSTTISWLERANYSRLSRSLPALVQFVTIAEDFSHVQSPFQNSSCFELSERDMPALYALSTRDYDQGLGLLVLGNMIGELALYSFGGDAFSRIHSALRSLDVRPWSGEELLPSVSTHNPRLYLCLAEVNPCSLVGNSIVSSSQVFLGAGLVIGGIQTRLLTTMGETLPARAEDASKLVSLFPIFRL